jgi:hypothetical protein
MKICNTCKNELPESSFRLHKNKHILNKCKKCCNKQGKVSFKTRRAKLREALSEFKTTCGCFNCGWNQFTEGLDLHHLDGEDKESTVANLLNRGQHSFIKIITEIRKCIVLCSNCHRGVHNNRITLTTNNVPRFTYEKY